MSFSRHNKIYLLYLRVNVSAFHYSLILAENKNKDARENGRQRWNKILSDIRLSREQTETENDNARIAEIIDRYQAKRYTFYTFK